MLLKDDLLKLFAELSEHRLSLQSINKAFIVLIPKIDSPLEMEDVRPISLVHILIKIISKVLTNRLQKFITDLIDDMKSGFIRGRSIVEFLSLLQK